MPPPRATQQNSPFNRKAQHDAKRVAILSEAARLFNGKGSRATTLQDVAQGLGLTKTSLYYYVSTKEDLIFQCYELALQRQHALLDDLDKQALPPLDRAREFFRNHFRGWLKAQDGQDIHVAALLEIASLKPAHRSLIESEYVRMFKRLRGYLREAADAQQIRPLETTSATRAILGATDWLFYWLHQVDRDSVMHTADAAWDVLLQGLHAGTNEFRPRSLAVGMAGDRRAQGFDRQEQNRQKQEAFYKAGTWFFNKAGFNGASLDAIAEHLNVSKGAFYYHIRNKEDLLYACYERSLDIMQRIYRQITDEELSGLQKLDEVARRVFHAQNSDGGPLIRYNTITALPPPRRKEILAQTEATNSRFDAFIRKGIEDGSVRPLEPFLARSLMTGAINASMDIGLWRQVKDIDSAAKDYFDIFYNGLLPRAVRPMHEEKH